MIFGKKVDLKPYKDYLIIFIRTVDYTVVTDSESCFTVSFIKDARNISISINNLNKGYITVDVIDNYAIIRIPRTKFSKLEEYKEFCINSLGFLQT